MDNLYFGWTEKQWAIALGHYKTNIETVRQALNVRSKYLKSYRGDPEEQPLICDDGGNELRTLDWKQALNVVSLTGAI